MDVQAYDTKEDIDSQLTKILERNGVWEAISKQKAKAKSFEKSQEKQLSDIICGTAYQEQIQDGRFLSTYNSISGIFNTDGVQLYSSSGVKLWPIYVAINELPIRQRFSRENMLLVGIWQGKGQPPYFD